MAASAASAASSAALALAAHPDHPVSRVQHAGLAAHRMPPGGGHLGHVRLAEDLAVDFEHRVAADDDSRKAWVQLLDARGDLLGFEPCKQQHCVVWGEVAGLNHRGLFVDPRCLGQWFNPRCAQQCQSGG